MQEKINNIDKKLISFFHKISYRSLRFAIAVVFIWFGGLKVLGLSPATPLVQALYDNTIVSGIGFNEFMIFFGLFEVLIGLLFLIRGAERIVLPLLVIHMTTTMMPLFVLSNIIWQAPLVPTLEGQYIIKNIVIIAAAITIAGNLRPFKNKPS